MNITTCARDFVDLIFRNEFKHLLVHQARRTFSEAVYMEASTCSCCLSDLVSGFDFVTLCKVTCTTNVSKTVS